MVRVEWQYYQTKNIARSSHFIPGPYFIPCPQSVVRSPQSAVRPRFTVRSRSETLYPAALRTYNAARLQQKHTYQWKNIQIISLKTSRLWYRQAFDCCWRNISPRDGSTKTCNTPSLQDDRRLVCSRATSGFTPPPVTVIFGLFSFFVFLDYENQKTIFISDFIIIDTVSRSFVTNEKLCQVWIFNKLESME